MAFDEHLGERISDALKTKKIRFEEKKMMGGLCYMINEKMCVGVIKDSLLVRVDPDFYTEALTKNGCRQMDFTGKPMKSFVIVDPEGIDMDVDLEYWIAKGLEFNPKAKASRKKKV